MPAKAQARQTPTLLSRRKAHSGHVSLMKMEFDICFEAHEDETLLSLFAIDNAMNSR